MTDAENEYQTEITVDATPRFPWPPAEDGPVVAGLVETWRSAIAQPTAFFRALPADGSTGAAILYYMVIGILGAAIQVFWGVVLPTPDAGFLEPILGSAPDASPLVEFLLSPLYLLFSLFVVTSVVHLMVLILVAGNRGYGATLRTLCYAYSPTLFAVVPWLGAIVGFVWLNVVAIIGLREVHRTSTGRAATAVLVPLIIAVLFVAMAAIMLVAAGGLLLD